MDLVDGKILNFPPGELVMKYENLTEEGRRELNLQYRARLTIPDADQCVANTAARSAIVRKSILCHIDIPYGSTSLQTLDIFPADNCDAPVFFYIHGGYWFELDKSIYSEVAGPMVSAGITTVLPNYDLCPAVSISDIVTQVRAALYWVYKNIAQYNGNPNNIFVSGHSAGGHLTGMMMATDWHDAHQIPRDVVKGTAPLSGLFDIEPHRHTNLQPHIRLTKEDVVNNSPQNLPVNFDGWMICAVGGGETDAFRRQSKDYSEKCSQLGVDTKYIETGNDHHFQITDRLADSKDQLTSELIRRMLKKH